MVWELGAILSFAPTRLSIPSDSNIWDGKKLQLATPHFRELHPAHGIFIKINQTIEINVLNVWFSHVF
jgi:hypothetical protein